MSTTTDTPRAETRALVIGIVLPVYNEEAELRRNVLRPLDHLQHGFPFTYRVTIADNASTDSTDSTAVVLGTSVWAYVLLDRSADWYSWLRFAVVAGGVIAAGLIVGVRAGRRLALAGALTGVVMPETRLPR